ncbi:MAG: hypothetical protein JSR80_02810 [Verrucomicrobia bacterium]|nr:hypothetical protein [Verrucomicrobiota bacterium]
MEKVQKNPQNSYQEKSIPKVDGGKSVITVYKNAFKSMSYDAMSSDGMAYKYVREIEFKGERYLDLDALDDNDLNPELVNVEHKQNFGGKLLSNLIGGCIWGLLKK